MGQRFEIRRHAALRSKVSGRCIENVGHAALSAMIWDDRCNKVRKHAALREIVSDYALIADDTHFVQRVWISIHRGQASLRIMIWEGA